MSYTPRTHPPRKTEAERILTHAATYGRAAPLPARQYRFNPARATLATPEWVVPAIIGGAGLLLIYLITRK